jgi:hypothetical protein
LFAPMNEAGATTGEYTHRSTTFSPFTRHLEFYPNRKRLLLAVAAAGAFALLRRQRSTDDEAASARPRVGKEPSELKRRRAPRSLPPRH